MNTFSLEVDSESFAERDVKLNFNESRYQDLVDCLYTPAQGVESRSLALYLRRSWLWSTDLKEVLGGLVKNGAVSGKYYKKSTSLSVFCVEDPNKTNQSLLHETSHWADDMNGDSMPPKLFIGKVVGATYLSLTAATWTGYEASGLANGATGVAVGIAVGALTTGALIKAETTYVNYREPGEIRARAFGTDPDVVAEFGQIISYSQL